MSKSLSIVLLGILAAVAIAQPKSVEEAFTETTGQVVITEPWMLPAHQKEAADEQDDTISYGGLRFTLPEDWQPERTGDKLVLWSPDEEVAVTVWTTDEKHLDKANARLDQLIAAVVTDIEQDSKPEKGVQNDLRFVWLSGSGYWSEEDVDCYWQASLVQSRRVVVFLAVGEDCAMEEHEEALTELDESIEAAASNG